MASVGSKIIGNLTNPLITDHDYYPIQVEIASLLANEWSVPVLLAAFAGICGTVLLLAMTIVQKRNPNLRTIEKATIMWFVLCKLPTARRAIWRIGTTPILLELPQSHYPTF